MFLTSRGSEINTQGTAHSKLNTSAAIEEVSQYVYDFISILLGNINPLKVEPLKKKS